MILIIEINKLKEYYLLSLVNRRRYENFSLLIKIKLKKKRIFISISSTLEKNRFRIKELGYFDNTGNVYIFVNKLKIINKIKSVKLIKNYFIFYFIN